MLSKLLESWFTAGPFGEDEQRYPCFGSLKPRLFQAHVVLTGLQQYPTWSALTFQNFPLMRCGKSDSTVMYKSFVYPCIHYTEGDVWPAYVHP